MGIFYTTVWSRPTQFSGFLFRVQYDWIRTKSSEFSILKHTNGYLWSGGGNPIYVYQHFLWFFEHTETFIFNLSGFLWQGVQRTETNPLKTACGLGGGGSEGSVHVGQSRRFTRLLLYRRLQFVSSLQNNFRMTFPILPLSHIYLWLKWSWISGAEVGKDSLFEWGCAHVCAAFGVYDVVSKGTRRLFSHVLASWKQTSHFHYHSLRHTWTMFSTLNTYFGLQICITHCAS